MAIEIIVPRLGWTMEEGTFVEWLKHDGDAVHSGDLLYRIEGDKALTEVEALDEGILRIPPDSPALGTTIPVGTLLAYLVAPGERAPFEQTVKQAQPQPAAPTNAPAPAPQPTPPALKPTSTTPANSPPAISPRALRVAMELGVDWARLKGSGRTGRIVEADVRAAATVSKPMPAPVHTPASSMASAEQRQPVSPMRRVIAQRMAAGVHTAAPVTLSSEVDATELVRLREQLKAEGKASVIPAYTDLLAKIVATALRDHPMLNARMEGDEIVVSSAVHIGIAVDTPRGLLAPVLRDVQARSLLQIAAASAALVARTREGQASAEELQGGTFTLTNLGMYDIDAFSPILNLPECAILGMGRIVPKQVVTLRPGSIDEAERVAVRRMLTLSLTFDHRLVDGALAARFLQRVKQLIEQPYLWLVS